MPAIATEFTRLYEPYSQRREVWIADDVSLRFSEIRCDIEENIPIVFQFFTGSAPETAKIDVHMFHQRICKDLGLLCLLVQEIADLLQPGWYGQCFDVGSMVGAK